MLWADLHVGFYILIRTFLQHYVSAHQRISRVNDYASESATYNYLCIVIMLEGFSMFSDSVLALLPFRGRSHSISARFAAPPKCVLKSAFGEEIATRGISQIKKKRPHATAREIAPFGNKIPE
jgi:hypothetical protein